MVDDVLEEGDGLLKGGKGDALAGDDVALAGDDVAVGESIGPRPTPSMPLSFLPHTYIL